MAAAGFTRECDRDGRGCPLGGYDVPGVRNAEISSNPAILSWTTAIIVTLSGRPAISRRRKPSNCGGLYLSLMDLDIRDPKFEDAAWMALLKVLPNARDYPAVISGSGGVRHLFRRAYEDPAEAFGQKIDNCQRYDAESDQHGCDRRDGWVDAQFEMRDHALGNGLAIAE